MEIYATVRQLVFLEGLSRREVSRRLPSHSLRVPRLSRASVSAAFIVVVSDYLMALFVAAIFSSLLHPIYRRILVRCGGRSWLASTIILFGFVLAAGVPLVFVFGLVAGEAVALLRVAVSWISEKLSGPIGSTDLPERLPFSEALEPYRAMLLDQIEGTAVAEFYSVRSGTIPPLPWPTFAPPLTKFRSG